MGNPKAVIPAAPANKTNVIADIKTTETGLKNGFVEIVVQGKVGDAIPRPGFEKKYPLPKEAGLPGYDRCHIAGPDATGTEEGIVYAPKNFNIGKNAQIENMIRDAREQANLQGGEAHIQIRVIAKNMKEVDGVTIRVMKEIEWTVVIRKPNGQKIPMLTNERVFLKPPESAPQLWSGYEAAGLKSVAFAIAGIAIQKYIHQPEVEKRVVKQVEQQGYVSVNAPSEQGLLYDLGAWLLDPFRDAEFSVSMDKRFDVKVWRDRLKKSTDAKKRGEKFEIEWDVGSCKRDNLFDRQIIEQRTIVYRKQPDDSWKVESGDATGTPNLNYLLAPSTTDSDVQDTLFGNACGA